MYVISQYTGFNFNKQFEYPVIDVIYGSLKNQLSSSLSRACIVPNEESINLSKELEKRGFDVLCHTHKYVSGNSTPKILYASPIILRNINQGRELKTIHAKTLQDNLTSISKP